MPSFRKQTDIIENDMVLGEDWVPKELPERETELSQMYEALSPATRGFTPDNMFLYGKAGQGKTAATRSALNDLKHFFEDEMPEELTPVYVSCNELSSSYQVTGQLLVELNEDVTERPNGHAPDILYSRLFGRLDEIGGTIVIVFDEIDAIGDDDQILYQIPRAHSNGKLEEAKVSFIGISNDFSFRDNLSPKVKDTLYDYVIDFPSYDSEQLCDILTRRADIALAEDVLDDGVIELCSAYAAKDEGSARQAINHLYKASKMAQTDGDDVVTTDHVETAHDILKRNHVMEGIRGLTPQNKYVLTAVTLLEVREETPARTGEVYPVYREIAESVGSEPLVRRRMRDHLQELSLHGQIALTSQSGGVKGGTYYVAELNTDLEATITVLSEVDEAMHEVAEDLRAIAEMKGML
ncbi:Cdc6/Cdc18 family protein [Halomarina ordinaria]|uniref:ORC1-type DNA replication protein n=1 Tax=Halomarina ordinaria TaxID=3033939 RepID=A0ABD5U540_9EURY|nr:orc1/cdc6 family replication initiation protein [Halomarina sp. PSRA2]